MAAQAVPLQLRTLIEHESGIDSAASYEEHMAAIDSRHTADMRCYFRVAYMALQRHAAPGKKSCDPPHAGSDAAARCPS
jgi:hypothetical protein